MFRVIATNGLDIHFERYNNGNWKATAHKGRQSFEVAHSITHENLPFVVRTISEQPEDNNKFKAAARKLKKLIEQT